MDKKKILWIVLGSIAALALIVGVTVSTINRAPEPEPTSSTSGTGGIIDPNTGEEEPAPEPTPTLEPKAEDNPEGGDALGSDSKVFEEMKPLYMSTAEDFLTQYLKWDSEEAPADRAARLAPFVAPDSPLLTATPGISLVDENPTYDYSSETELTWIDQRYTSWAMPSGAEGNALYISVMGNYSIDQSSVGGTVNSFWESGGTFYVQFADFDGSANPVVVDVREPKYTKR